MATKVLDILIKGKDMFSPAAKSAGDSAKQLGKDAAQADKGFSWKQQNKDWRRSETAAMMKQMKGAGAAAAVTFLAKEFEAATETAVDMTNKFRLGKASTMDVVNGFAGMVPVVGKVWTTMYKAGSNIDEMWTGKKFQASMEENELGMWMSAQKFVERNNSLADKSHKETTKHMQSLSDKDKLRGLEGFTFDQTKFDQSTANEIQALKDKKEEKLQAIDEQTKLDKEAIEKSGKDKEGNVLNEKALKEQQKRIEENAAETKKKIAADIDTEINATTASRNADRIELERKHQEDLKKVLDQGKDIQIDLAASANAFKLQEQNRGFEAELAMMDLQTEKKKQKLQDEYEKQIKGETEANIKKLTQNKDTIVSGLDSETGAKKESLFTKTVNDEKLARLDLLASLGDSNAKFEAERIRAADNYVKKYYELKAIIDGTSNADTKSKALAEQEILKDLEKKKLDKNLKDTDTSLLESQAKYGTFNERNNAEKELARQKLMKEFEAKQAEVKSIYESDFSTQDHKDKASQQLEQWAKYSANEFDSMTGAKQDHLNRVSNVQSNLLMNGGLAATRESNPNQLIAKNTAEGNKIQKEMLTSIKEMVKQLQGSTIIKSGITKS